MPFQQIPRSRFKTQRQTSHLPRIVLFLSILLLISSIIYAFSKLGFASRPENLETANSLSSSSSSDKQDNSSEETQSVFSEKTQEEVKPQGVEMNLLFAGDVFWGRYIHDWSEASDLKTKYPFSALQTFEPEKYDAWIANLECPITKETLDSSTQENLLKFACRPEYLQEAAKYFKVFSLANNHTDNMEEYEGFKQTRQFLDQAGIQYFGHYDNSQVGDLCEVVSLPVRLIYDSKDIPKEKQSLSAKESLKKQESFKFSQSKAKIDVIANTKDQKKEDKTKNQVLLPIALCGYHNVFRLPLEQELLVISKYSEYLPTFIMPHQGAEYGAVADSLQESFFRRMIDLGADAVLGNHPHSIHNTESYKGKLIAYSLGNFIFDQQASIVVTRSLLINLKLFLPYNNNLQKWLDLAPLCQKFKDECLKEAKERKLRKPDFQIKYDAIGSDNAGKLTKRASAEVEKWILERARWESTKKALTNAKVSQSLASISKEDK